MQDPPCGERSLRATRRLLSHGPPARVGAGLGRAGVLTRPVAWSSAGRCGAVRPARRSGPAASSSSPTVFVPLASGRRRPRRSAATSRSRKMIVWPVMSSSPITTNSRSALTPGGHCHTTLSGVRTMRNTSTTSWNRKQPRPGPRSGSRSSPLYWTGPVGRGGRGGVGSAFGSGGGRGRPVRRVGGRSAVGHSRQCYGSSGDATGSAWPGSSRAGTTSTPGRRRRIGRRRDDLPRPGAATEDDPLAGHDPVIHPDRQARPAIRRR